MKNDQTEKRECSDRKRAACRANGAKAAATRSAEAAERCKENALKHGMTAECVLLEHESVEDFNRWEESLIDIHQPEDVYELHMVQRLAHLMWRQHRGVCWETSTLDLRVQQMRPKVDQRFSEITGQARSTLAIDELANESRTFDLLMRYDTQTDRAITRTLDRIRQHRADRERKLRNDANPTSEHPVAAEVDQEPRRPRALLRSIPPTDSDDDTDPDPPAPLCPPEKVDTTGPELATDHRPLTTSPAPPDHPRSQGPQ